jgi:hypothetical protein
MSYPTNIEFHVFQTREGLWRVRVDGLGPRVTLGTKTGYESPSAALEAAAMFVRTYQVPAGWYIAGERSEIEQNFVFLEYMHPKYLLMIYLGLNCVAVLLEMLTDPASTVCWISRFVHGSVLTL